MDPAVGGKVAGKVGALSIAHLTALDEDVDAAGRDALFNVTRLRRDIGTSSLAGITVTDRSVLDSAAYNRVAAADTRIVFGGMYFFEAQLGGSWTRHRDSTVAAPIWKAELDRTGRSFGFNYSVTGTGTDFESHAGFVNRNDIISAGFRNRYTYYGATGARIERVTVFFGPSRIWRYDGGGSIEGSEFLNASFRLRGDWEISGRAGRDFVELDPGSYASYVTDAVGGPRPYQPLADVSGPSYELSASTPTFRRFDASASAGFGRVAIFSEGSEGDARRASASLALRPARTLRVDLSTAYQRIDRARDGSEFARTLLPRIRVEYQPKRSFFMRGIAEYRDERRAALRDARTGEPILVNGAPTVAFDNNGVSIEVLASYQPTPGTVAFLGYAVALVGDPLDGASRVRDGLFLKLGYVLR